MKVFVTVGTHSQQFNRLLKEADEIAKKNTKLTFFAQTGNSTYLPKNYSCKRFLAENEYENSFKKANIIVSHGGAGSIINALKFKKTLIVVPRLKKFKEHTNDHQLELAEFFEKKGKCLFVTNITTLSEVIEKAKKFKPKIEENKEKLVLKLKSFLNECEMKK